MKRNIYKRDNLVLINNNDSTATKNDHEGQHATVKCTSALLLLKQRKAREEKSNTLMSINSHHMHQQLSCDALVKEIVSTKLDAMINSVEERDKTFKTAPLTDPQSNVQKKKLPVLLC